MVLLTTAELNALREKPQLDRADVQRLRAEGREDMIVAAKTEGRLDNLLAGPAAPNPDEKKQRMALTAKRANYRALLAAGDEQEVLRLHRIDTKDNNS